MQHAENVVVLVGGHIIEDPQNPGHFRTSRLDETDYGIIGDSLRGEAVNFLYWRSPSDTSVIVLGGVTPLHKSKPDAPHLSTVIKQELIALGVPSSAIEELDIDPDCGTYMQLLHLSRTLAQQPQVTKVEMIANQWQIPRIRSMVLFGEDLDGLRRENPFVQIFAAEDVVVGRDPSQWREKIVDAYRTPAMRETIKRELKGAFMVAEGTYQYPTGAPNRFLHEKEKS